MTADELAARVRSLHAERARPMARWQTGTPLVERLRVAEEVARVGRRKAGAS